ncbi:glycosyltransferase [Fibrella forsythiae]|uniref:Glycosyltransferase n=1 Tax=Fibrella forsythiae TaxID=2817061 RepID=A0ABS3JRA3_9BACT|nr:glycosyltransferase [Fibrella forsythiae]MBO0951467.1 glycosyltransferase [Fibrella forsythiae]
MPELPYVSVLVAARNEETTIGSCLAALAAISYPADRYEVLIGNDGSTDQTTRIVQTLIADKPNFSLVSIRESAQTLNGKANVLSQLAQLAKGEFLFITDADVHVPATWLTGLLAAFEHHTGVATGTTLISGNSLWARVQAIDWLLAFGLIQLGSQLNLPLTGSGNNMAIRRKAYDAVGGFQGLPFSVVEDYTLFQAIVAKGYGFAHRLEVDVLASTLPAPSLSTYLQQRKRWMKGAFSLPIPLLVGVLFQYLLAPMLLIVALFSPTTALSIYLGKWLFQNTVLFWTLQRTRQHHRWFDALIFEPCQIMLGTLSMIYYVLPIPIRWKGRTY